MVLPVTQDELYLGLAEVNGILWVEQEFLEIEYQIKDVALGLIDSGIKNARIPLRDIEHVNVKKKWFSGKIDIYLNRLPNLDKQLKLTDNSLVFKCKKKDLEKARTLQTTINIYTSEQKLKDLDEEDDDFHSERFRNRSPEKPDRKTNKSGNHQPQDRNSLKNMLRDDDPK